MVAYIPLKWSPIDLEKIIFDRKIQILPAKFNARIKLPESTFPDFFRTLNFHDHTRIKAAFSIENILYSVYLDL